MLLSIAEHELHHACKIIFGSTPNITNDFLEYLQWSGIKRAYRRRAFETHPDRVASLGTQAQQHNADKFKIVQEAYENLTIYLKARDNGYNLVSTAFSSIYGGTTDSHGRWSKADRHQSPRPKNNSADKHRKSSGKMKNGWHNNSHFHQKKTQSTADRLYTGSLPLRPLVFGHFLYYSKIVSWRMVALAMIWQRTKRPRLGEIGCRLGMFTQEDIQHILTAKTQFMPFGQSAMNLGFITDQQLNILIRHQKLVQKKIGQYFVGQNIITLVELEILLKKLKQHNALFASL